MFQPTRAERGEVEEWRLQRHAAAVRMRWGALVAISLQVWISTPPPVSRAAAMGVTAVVLIYNLGAWRLERRLGRWPDRLRGAFVAADFVCATGWISLYLNHPSVAAYFGYTIVGTEAAVLYTWRGFGAFTAGLAAALPGLYWVQAGVWNQPVQLNEILWVSAVALTVTGMVAMVTRNGDHQHAEVVRLSVTDPLTGLANRRAFLAELDQEVTRAQRQQHRLSLLSIDLDHFKDVNDRFGHAAGDASLRALGRLLAASLLRAGVDLGGRMGGEEFGVLLPDTRLPQAAAVGERLRAAVAEPVSEVRTTISVGVAELQPGQDADRLLRAADQALYRAKRQGRNRVAVAEPAAEPALSGAGARS